MRGDVGSGREGVGVPCFGPGLLYCSLGWFR